MSMLLEGLLCLPATPSEGGEFAVRGTCSGVRRMGEVSRRCSEGVAGATGPPSLDTRRCRVSRIACGGAVNRVADRGGDGAITVDGIGLERYLMHNIGLGSLYVHGVKTSSERFQCDFSLRTSALRLCSNWYRATPGCRRGIEGAAGSL